MSAWPDLNRRPLLPQSSYYGIYNIPFNTKSTLTLCFLNFTVYVVYYKYVLFVAENVAGIYMKKSALLVKYNIVYLRANNLLN